MMQSDQKQRQQLLFIYSLLLALPLDIITAQGAEGQWVTVLAVRSGLPYYNIYSLLMTDGAMNDAKDKETQPIEDITAFQNFKSELVEQWAYARPQQVRLILCDQNGHDLWFTIFNNTQDDKNPDKWMKTSSIHVSSDSRLQTSHDADIIFNHVKLEIRLSTSNEGRLLMTWNQSPPSFLFATEYYYNSPAKLKPVTVKDNKELVLAHAFSTQKAFLKFKSGIAFLIFLFRPYYLAGIGLQRDASDPPGRLHQFQLAVTLDPVCHPHKSENMLLYKPVNLPGTSTPRTFNVSYEYGADRSLSLFWFHGIVAAYCVKLTVINATGGDHNTGIFLYESDSRVLTASIAAIQWWIDIPDTTTPTLTTSETTDISIPPTTVTASTRTTISVKPTLPTSLTVTFPATTTTATQTKTETSSAKSEPSTSTAQIITSGKSSSPSTSHHAATTVTSSETVPTLDTQTQRSDINTTVHSVCSTVIVCPCTPTADVRSTSSAVIETDGLSRNVTALNSTQMEKIREEIREALSVTKKETSRFKRQFVSMPDNRMSSKLIGVFGISFISMVLLGILLLDMHTLILQLKGMLTVLHEAFRASKQPLNRQLVGVPSFAARLQASGVSQRSNPALHSSCIQTDRNKQLGASHAPEV